MALKDWPERIRYSWTDEDAGTPYSLVVATPASAIAFIISQRNNLVSADDLLASLSDADTGESLAASTNAASVDDVAGVATGQGVTLPEPEPVDPDDPDDDAAFVPTVSDDEVVSPVSSDTTSSANFTGTGRPTAPAEVPPSNVETPQDTANTPTETVTSGYVGTGGDTPVVADVTPAESLPGESAPSGEDGTAESDVPAEETSDALYAPETPEQHDDEDDDFDSDIRHDDEPESEDAAPSIGQPTTETPGVTGV